MAAILSVNPKAEVARHSQALSVNIQGAKGLMEVLRTNLGPKGTLKMLVSGGGDIKITKDGNVLLHEMQIQHPTASMIAKASTAQNDDSGDGTTSTVVFIGELLKQAELHVNEGLHPRVIADGFEIAKKKTLELLEKYKIAFDENNRQMLVSLAQTALRTKLKPKIADKLSEICVEAVLAVRREGSIDLNMVEIVEMQHRSEEETSLIKGLVLDHGPRHPDMKRYSKNAYILTCNVSLEYEKTVVNSGFFYKSAEERIKLATAEREFIEQRCQKIIELKEKVCKDNENSFVVINQQGIDPNSLDILCKAGIVALRRAKRRNMERLTLACGGQPMNSLDELTPECLGFAGVVYEHVLGEEKYTFVEECKDPKSVTILIKAAHKHLLAQVKNAVEDGLQAVRNALEDKFLVPGAGAFEIAAHNELVNMKASIKGKAQLGFEAFANALLIIPKTLAINAGFDPQEVIVTLLHDHNSLKEMVGIDLDSGESIKPQDRGIYDNYRVKRQMLHSCASIASNLLLVDEIMRAGLTSLKEKPSD